MLKEIKIDETIKALNLPEKNKKNLETVFFKKRNNLLLVCYNKNFYSMGWNNLSKNSRGKVIDLKTMKVVSHGFDKFFNLGEEDGINQEEVEDLLQDETVRVSITEKIDGSNINISKYNNKLIITTKGSFDSAQVGLAKEVLDEKYEFFKENIREGFTYIFELIHPENKIILDYGETKKLYLLGIRDLNSKKLLMYEELKEEAREMKLDIVKQEENFDILKIMKDGHYSKKEKEGWVIRIVTNKKDIMFKVKLKKYLELAKITETMNLKKVYELYKESKIDDIIPKLDKEYRNKMKEMIGEINFVFETVKEILRDELRKVELRYGLTPKNFTDDKNRPVMIEAIEDMDKNITKSQLINILKNKTTVENIFSELPRKKEFIQYVDIVNKRKGTSIDCDTVRIIKGL